MYSAEEKRKFMNAAESLKKYRRADLIDENGKVYLINYMLICCQKILY